MIPFIEFKPLAEFIDRSGKVRAIAGCSLLGRLEFWERLESLYQLMEGSDPNLHWQEFYQSSKQFQHNVHRCLELNGIDPDWINFAQLEALLFHRFDEETEEWKPGWLVELNNPPEPETARKAEDPLSAEELVAAIAATANNLKEAIELASTVPADFLLGVAQAQIDNQNPEAREQKTRRRKVNKLKKELGMDKIKELLSTPLEQLQQNNGNPV